LSSSEEPRERPLPPQVEVRLAGSEAQKSDLPCRRQAVKRQKLNRRSFRRRISIGDDLRQCPPRVREDRAPRAFPIGPPRR
jgi:hypothetical protein